MTPDQHRQQAVLNRARGTLQALELAQHHENLARLIEAREAKVTREQLESTRLTPSEITSLREDKRRALTEAKVELAKARAEKAVRETAGEKDEALPASGAYIPKRLLTY